MVLFASIQILLGNVLDATKVIENYGLKYKSDKFCVANMYKIFGITYLMEEARNDAIACFDKSLKCFKELKSYHGQASVYYLKSLAIRIHDYEDEYNNVNSQIEAKKLAEKAMFYYKIIQHRDGFIASAALFGSDENPPNKVVNFEMLNDPNYVPYIDRQTQYEFMSLGIEPTFTTKFDKNIDIEEEISSKKRRTTRISSGSGMIRKMGALKTNQFLASGMDDIKLTKVYKNESKTMDSQAIGKIDEQKAMSIVSGVIHKKFAPIILNKVEEHKIEPIKANLNKDIIKETDESIEKPSVSSASPKKSIIQSSRNFKSITHEIPRKSNSKVKNNDDKIKEQLQRKKEIQQRYTFTRKTNSAKKYNSNRTSSKQI